MSDEGTIVQKQGEIIAVQPTKTGWTEIHLQEDGKQYPYKASTKIEAIIEAAQAALFKEAVLTAKEVDSGNPNPNRPGHNYINRTAMKVEMGVAMDVPALAPASSSGASRNGGSRTGATDRSIERQVILKEMVQHYPVLDALDVAGWWALMDRLDNFMVNGAAVKPDGTTADDIPF